MKELTPLTNRMSEFELTEELRKVMDEFNNLVGEYYDFIKDFYESHKDTYGENYVKENFVKRDFHFVKLPWRGFSSKTAIIEERNRIYYMGVNLEREFAREKEVAEFINSDAYVYAVEERERRKNELEQSKPAVYTEYKEGVTKLFESFCIRHNFKITSVSWYEARLRSASDDSRNDYISIEYSAWEKKTRLSSGTIYYSSDVTSLCQAFSELLCQKNLIDGFVEKATTFVKDRTEIDNELDEIEQWFNMHKVGYIYNNFNKIR